MSTTLTAGQTFAAIAMFGDVTKHLPHFLTKDGLITISLVEYFIDRGHFATCETQLNDPEIVDRAMRAQNMLRTIILDSLTSTVTKPRTASTQDAELKHKLQQAKQQLLQMNKVHDMGTVDEISKKLGISKSEVRRRKRDGLL